MNPGLHAPLLEVVALRPVDAERAAVGGADSLHVCAPPPDRDDDDEALSLPPADVSAIVRASDLPVRVTLRLSEGFTTSGAELARLEGLVTDYLAVGVEGFVFGFLTPDLDVDVDVCARLANELVGAPWTFDRAFDHALDARRAWRSVAGLPGLDRVHTAGALLGVDSGLDDLTAMAAADREFASVVVATGGLQPEHVPWLLQAGVHGIRVGAAVRPGGSWAKASVDEGFVRSWRRLLDEPSL